MTKVNKSEYVTNIPPPSARLGADGVGRPSAALVYVLFCFEILSMLRLGCVVP